MQLRPTSSWVVLTTREVGEPLAVSRSRHGMPAADLGATVRVRFLTRAQDTRGLEAVIEECAPVAMDDLALTLDVKQFQCALFIDVDVPLDAVTTQAVWALICCALEGEQDGVVVDAIANKAWFGKDVIAWPRPVSRSVDRDISFWVEEAQLSEIRTQGLSKFGAAELFAASIPHAALAETSHAFRGLAMHILEGKRLSLGDGWSVGPDAHFTVAHASPTELRLTYETTQVLASRE